MHEWMDMGPKGERQKAAAAVDAYSRVNNWTWSIIIISTEERSGATAQETNRHATFFHPVVEMIDDSPDSHVDQYDEEEGMLLY